MDHDHYDLSHLGWDNCILPSDLKDISARLPNYKHLKSMRVSEIHKGVRLLFPHRFFRHRGMLYMPAFQKGALYMDGGYARIFRGKRAIFRPLSAHQTTGKLSLKKTTKFKDICIKEIELNITEEEDAAPPPVRTQSYIDEINAILYEACIHALVQKTLEREGYGDAVPIMYDVLANARNVPDIRDPTSIDSVWITMKFMQGVTLETFLRKTLIRLPHGGHYSPAQRKRQLINERILLDVCIQLAYYLYLLQKHIRFNHRDMKINNVYIQYHGDGRASDDGEKWSQTIPMPIIGRWSCMNHTILLDFGFSCIACGPGYTYPRRTLVGAGSWFPSESDCLKMGRDLAQFLYSLHACFPLQDYISHELYAVFHRAFQATTPTSREPVDLMKGVDEAGRPIYRRTLPHTVTFHQGIYLFLCAPGTEVPGCEPFAFLHTLASYIQDHAAELFVA